MSEEAAADRISSTLTSLPARDAAVGMAAPALLPTCSYELHLSLSLPSAPIHRHKVRDAIKKMEEGIRLITC